MVSPDRIIQAYSADGETVQCMKCERSLHTKDIAMLIRTTPTDAFNAWCPTCTLWVVKQAALGLDISEIGEIVTLF